MSRHNKYTDLAIEHCSECRYSIKEETTALGVQKYKCNNPQSKYHNQVHRAEFPCDDGFNHIKMKYYLR